MEVMQVLHMNKGDGETSYAKNSSIQSQIISIAKPVIEEAMLEMLCTNIPSSVGIAELGCSSGPNALLAVSEIIDIVHVKCQYLGHPTPEFTIFLNDLPSNDFNCIFGLLPEFYKKLKEEKGAGLGQCFISATPGSFYDRIFPTRSLHCVHSSSSLHWLSQVPEGLGSPNTNKGKIYISETSPQCVLDSYSQQFQRDFSQFLRSRSKEIVPGGCMVLSFMGRRSTDPTSEESCYHWELLAQALISMVLEGLIEEEKVDSFNAPYYGPSAEEVILEIEKEGSFIIHRLDRFEIEWDAGGDDNQSIFSTQSRGKRVAKTIRAVVESMLESHFGGDIMDDLFERYGVMVDDYLAKAGTKYTNLVVSVFRRE